jgi:hypothetical protein
MSEQIGNVLLGAFVGIFIWAVIVLLWPKSGASQ